MYLYQRMILCRFLHLVVKQFAVHANCGTVPVQDALLSTLRKMHVHNVLMSCSVRLIACGAKYVL